MGCTYPTIWKFIDVLKKQDLTDWKIVQKLIKQPPASQHKKWLDCVRRLNAVIDNYDDNDRLDFLKCVGSIILNWMFYVRLLSVIYIISYHSSPAYLYYTLVYIKTKKHWIVKGNITIISCEFIDKWLKIFDISVAINFVSHYSPGSALKCDNVDIGGLLHYSACRTTVRVALQCVSHYSACHTTVRVALQYVNPAVWKIWKRLYIWQPVFS